MTISDRERALLDHISGKADDLLDDLRRHVGLMTGGMNLSAIQQSASIFSERCAALGAGVETVSGQEALRGELTAAQDALAEAQVNQDQIAAERAELLAQVAAATEASEQQATAIEAAQSKSKFD